MALHPALESDTPYYDALSEDPTATKTLREEYGRNLRGAYGRINTVIRKYVGEEDVLGLSSEALVTPPGDFSFETDANKLQGFESWLDQAQEEEVLNLINRDGNRYIERSWEKGVRDSDRALANAGVIDDPVDAVAARQLMQMPTHERKIQMIYSRNYQQLSGITQAVDQEVSRTLAESISEGVNPREAARRITDRVDKIGKTRSTVLARTEIVNAHAEASLTRFEQQGVEEVTGRVELSTATDNRVCEECASLGGNTYTIEEARGMIPQHPNCRCSWLPST